MLFHADSLYLFLCSVIRLAVRARYANQLSGWGAGIVIQAQQV